MIKRVLLTDDGKEFFVKDLEKDFHTHLGIVKSSELKKESGKVLTTKEKTLSIFVPTISDLIKKIKRGAAIIIPKDAGYIIVETGLNKNSKVLEAGTGSGALTIHLANTAKKVISYETNKTHYEISKQNIEELNLKNVTLKNKDIIESDEKNIDVIILDMPQPWDYLDMVKKSLKNAGFLVTYLPTIHQVMQQVEKCSDLRHIKTVELIEREWHVDGKKVRPKSQMIAHTAFLSFFRKI